LGTGVVWLCLVSGQMSGDLRGAFQLSTVAHVVNGSYFGTVFAVRLAGLVLLLLLIAFLRAYRTEVLVVIGALLLTSLGLTSHAAASAEFPASAVRGANDAVHLLTAGFWTGGLVTLAVLIHEHLQAPTKLIAPLRLFSLWGTYAVAALVLTGVLNALAILGLPALRFSLYRGVLAVKVALAGAMIALALLNRWRIGPALSHDSDAPRQLGLTVTAELTLAALVLGAAGTLGLLPPE